MIPELPEPSRERWQPLRAGLVDLFYYDTEEFWFRDGRLLLRGNNAPLVCTSGQPGAAVMHLLRTLADTDTDLHYHGDFDWGGIRIANVLFSRLPAQPWRFDAAAYRAEAAKHTHSALTGTPAVASWDPDLMPAMVGLGTKVEEELILSDLIADLANARAAPPRSDEA